MENKYIRKKLADRDPLYDNEPEGYESQASMKFWKNPITGQHGAYPQQPYEEDCVEISKDEFDSLHNYFNDLNALQRIINTLGPVDAVSYRLHLGALTREDSKTFGVFGAILRANPEQISEALAKTLEGCMYGD
jgi:hypothetical protein